MTDAKVWKEKDIRIARQSALKASVNLLDIAQRIGLLHSENVKELKDLHILHEDLSDKIFDYIYEGMN